MFRTMFVVAAAWAMAACSTTSSESPPPAAGPVASAVADSATPKREVVCRKVQKTGTRMRTRLCLYPEQWETLSDNAAQALDEVQRRAVHNTDMPGKGG